MNTLIYIYILVLSVAFNQVAVRPTKSNEVLIDLRLYSNESTCFANILHVIDQVDTFKVKSGFS